MIVFLPAFVWMVLAVAWVVVGNARDPLPSQARRHRLVGKVKIRDLTQKIRSA